MSRRRKIIISGLILLILLPLAIGLIFVGILATAFSNGATLGPPQDCILIERSFTGQIIDSNQKPVINATVDIRSDAGSIAGSGFETGVFSLTLKTDKNGRFSSKDISVFACDNIMVDISANGYESRHISYFGDDGYSKSAALEISTVLTTKPETR